MERLESRRAELESKGARIAAVSVDAIEDCRALADRLEVGFPLLADPGGATVRDYGVWHAEKEIALPAIVVVDAARTIRWKKVGSAIDDRPEEDEIVEAVDRVRREGLRSP